MKRLYESYSLNDPMIAGDEEIVRVLFMARANASLTDVEERAPIHLAAERGYTRLLQ
jgi:hypothetical protein